MLTKKTTLVLGAGASKPYGFPTGAELRNDILQIERKGILAESGLSFQMERVTPFLKDFRASRLSIDAFLAVRQEYEEVGKLAIAAILLEYEKNSPLHAGNPPEGEWYDHLWHKLVSGHSWEEVSFDQLSIVTFNYDRSLERFLFDACRAMSGLSAAEVISKLTTLKIIHVYGSLGEAWSLNGRQRLPYGSDASERNVYLAAAKLQIMAEARDDSAAFEEAKTALVYADVLCFLGFGFDSLNLRRLDSSRTCSSGRINSEGFSVGSRPVFASSFGKTLSERQADAGACSADAALFFDSSCIGTLRQFSVLS